MHVRPEVLLARTVLLRGASMLESGMRHTWVVAQLDSLMDGGQHPVMALPSRHGHKPVGLQGVQADVKEGHACVERQ